VLSEVEHVSDTVGILRSGKLVKVAQLEELRRIRVHRVEIEFAPGEDVPEVKLRAAPGVEDLRISGNRVECVVHGSFDGLLDAISQSRVTDLVSTEPSLEEFFLSFFGEPKLKALPS
jgi:ABC-2 type transport system ATP-binding protein